LGHFLRRTRQIFQNFAGSLLIFGAYLEPRSDAHCVHSASEFVTEPRRQTRRLKSQTMGVSFPCRWVPPDRHQLLRLDHVHAFRSKRSDSTWRYPSLCENSLQDLEHLGTPFLLVPIAEDRNEF